MANESFRDILAGLLDENEPEPKTNAAPSYIPETPSFHWENTSATFAKPSARYARTAAKVAEANAQAPAIAQAPAPTPEPVIIVAEPKWQFHELNSGDRARVKALVNLGAPEVAQEISQSSLKKAYRRLAKKLHPDVALAIAGKEKSQEDFLALQSIYECLSASLAALTSAKASGSESASARASQRRDAA